MRIELPTQKVSCVSFGGKDYHRLFISTARGELANCKPRNRRSNYTAGNLFHLQVDIKGRPELLSRVCKNDC